MWLRVAIVCLAGMLLCGCMAIKQGTFAKDWTNVMRENQIEPIFPMRENVQVGDAYELIYDDECAYQETFNTRGYLKIPHLLFSLSVQDKLRDYYRNERFGFAESEYNNGKRSDVKEYTSCPFDIAARDDYLRLPRVQFPNISYTVSNAAGIKALLPMGTIPVALNLSYDKVESVTLRLDGADYYSLPIDRILEAFDEYIIGVIKKKNNGSRTILDNWNIKRTVQIIYEVYQTREIAYTIATKSNLNTGLDLFATGKELKEGLEAISTIISSTAAKNSSLSVSNQQGDKSAQKLPDVSEEMPPTDDAPAQPETGSISDSDLPGEELPDPASTGTTNRKPADSPAPTPPATANDMLAQYVLSQQKEHDEAVKALSGSTQLAKDQAGTFHYAGHSTHSLSLVKTFDTPLVVGVRCLNITRTGDETFEIAGYGKFDFSTQIPFWKQMILGSSKAKREYRQAMNSRK